MDRDTHVRLAAFGWLRQQTELHGDVLPWSLLLRGFQFDGRRVPLVSQQGIFKPAVLPRIPLSIRTSHEGPYDDSFTADDLVLYRYRGTDPHHRENVGLRQAMENRRPLVYFHGVVPGKYLAVWPAYIVADDPARLTFTVQVDEAETVAAGLPETAHAASPRDEARRLYATATVRRRLHQRAFRERVLAAYREQCAMCRLRHHELLDAAHIIADSEDRGEPRIGNGLALCKIHHAAFDRHILGVRPDYRVEVRRDILTEIDGPMLRYGLQELNGQQILTPQRAAWRPDRELLAARYETFRTAG